MKRPPNERTILDPENGWEERSWYQVEVSFGTGNPIHLALLFTGFLNGLRNDRKKGSPGGYHMLINPTWDGPCTLGEVHYLKPLQCLGQLTREVTP